MIKYLLLFSMTLFSSLIQAEHLASPTDYRPLPEYSVKYDPARDPFSDGAQAIQLAQDSQRKVLIEVGGDWCKWCHVLDDFLKQNPHTEQQLHEHFVLLKINVSDENSNQDFLKSFPKPLGYPHMYVSDPDGNLLKSKDTAEFLVNGQYSTEAFAAFINKWSAHE